MHRVCNINMSLQKIVLYLALVVAAVCSYPIEHEEHYDHHPHYEFEYSVHDPHTHDIKSQKESRYGDQVKGYYKLKDADGSLREVHYSADHHNGFQAEVTKNGHPLYEQQAQHPGNDYHIGHDHHAFSSQKFYSH